MKCRQRRWSSTSTKSEVKFIPFKLAKNNILDGIWFPNRFMNLENGGAYLIKLTVTKVSYHIFVKVDFLLRKIIAYSTTNNIAVNTKKFEIPNLRIFCLKER